ncbi:MAG: redoxin domain-containing protein [Acidobacteria bacterium]|nr:redoxin domain-containing protein [Acidobacteriota bacterium]
MSNKSLIVVLCLSLVLGAATPRVGAQGVRAKQSEEAGVDERVRGRVRAPELAGHSGWLNTDKALTLAALRGKIVLLDFWTYGCINCLHVIPDLKRLEAKYAKELVVIGVHSAKFDNEKDTENIRRIILRYEIEHPVVNDANFNIWNSYAVRAWPTQVLIDPAGYVVGQVVGEGNYETIDRAISELATAARKRGELSEQPLKLALERAKVGDLPLAFPGKVLADEESGRLFIADSNHNRIVVARLDGAVTDVIGTGARGAAGGAFDKATFFRPQGLALDGDHLYVADTENHLIRRVDLKARTVETVAGTGQQGRGSGEEGRARARNAALNSPWDLHLVGRTLYVAMAGPHQIWQLDLERNRVSVFAGSGREARADGTRLASAFAQPSGLTSDGSTLYVADSESNIIRAVELAAPGEAKADDEEAAAASDENAERAPVGVMPPPDEDETQPGPTPAPTPAPRAEVTTLAGGDLFEFGDVDGSGDNVRLQHPLGVVYVRGALFIADTYNHKIKRLDTVSRAVKTFAGTGKPGQADGDRPTFYEPGGLSHAAGKLYVADTNNHAVRAVDLATGQTSTLRLRGLTPPAAAPPASDADIAAATSAEEIRLAPQRLGVGEGGALVINVRLPAGYHLNESAPHRVAATVERGAAVLALEGGKPTFTRAAKDLRLPVRLGLSARAAGAAELRVRLTLYYCREDNTGVCRIKTLAWRVPVEAAAGAPREIKLEGKVE